MASRFEIGEDKLNWAMKRLLPWLWGGGVGIYLLFLISAVYVGRALFADGANFFVGVLSGGDGWPVWDDTKHIRLFVNIVNQFLVSAAVRLGFDDVTLLRVLFGIGLFFVPTACLAYCVWISKRAGDFRIFVGAMASWVLFVLPAYVFSLNQAITTVALCWVLMHYVLLRLEIRKLDWFVVALIVFLLFRSHEGMALWGCVVAFSSVLSLRRDGARSINKLAAMRYFIAFFSVLHVVFVLYWQSTHPVAKETETFIGLLSYLSPSEAWIGNVRISIFVAVGSLSVLAGSFFRGLDARIARAGCWFFLGVYFCSFVMLVGYVVFGFLNGYRVDPVREYIYRFLIPFGTPWVMVAVALTYVGNWWRREWGAAVSMLVAVGLAGGALWQISSNAKWAEFTRLSVKAIENSGDVLIAPDGVKSYFNEKGKGYLINYGVGWTWPVLGLSLQRSRFVAWMVRPDGFDEYFVPPTEAEPYPIVPFLKLYPEGVFIFDDYLASKKKGE